MSAQHSPVQISSSHTCHMSRPRCSPAAAASSSPTPDPRPTPWRATRTSRPSTPSHTGAAQLLLLRGNTPNVRVADDYSQNNYGASETRDGYNTQGEYFVNLPDGRLQKVGV